VTGNVPVVYVYQFESPRLLWSRIVPTSTGSHAHRVQASVSTDSPQTVTPDDEALERQQKPGCLFDAPSYRDRYS
jgi:hypothetical protein